MRATTQAITQDTRNHICANNNPTIISCTNPHKLNHSSNLTTWLIGFKQNKPEEVHLLFKSFTKHINVHFITNVGNYMSSYEHYIAYNAIFVFESTETHINVIVLSHRKISKQVYVNENLVCNLWSKVCLETFSKMMKN